LKALAQQGLARHVFKKPSQNGSPKAFLITMPDKIRSYAELRELIRASLRTQNPDWVEPNGDSPICDSYEARFAELLGLTCSPEDDAHPNLQEYDRQRQNTTAANKDSEVRLLQ
jgi:hypothetical protein